MAIKMLCTQQPEILEQYLETADNIVIVILDHNKDILDCNPSFLKLMDLLEKPTGRNIRDFLIPGSHQDLLFPSPYTHRETRLNFLSHVSTTHALVCYIFNTGQQYILFGEKLMPTNNEIISKIAALNDEMTNLTWELHKKIRALERANAAITKLLHTDPLTGIANRRLFQETLPKAISFARRHSRPLSITMADVDRFKEINDSYGHSAGDKVLVAFAGLLQNSCRTEDLAARFGGEEFILLLLNTDSLGAAALAERVRQATEKLSLPSTPVVVTASFGVTQLAPADTVDTFFKRVDTALYEAKQSGRNRVVVK